MMKLFKKKDKNIEAEETLAKNAESVKTAADGKNAGAAQENKEDVPETIVCPKCGKTVLKSVVKQHKYVCYECNYYFRVRAKNRIRMVSDKEAFEPWFTELTTGNPLNFPEYEEKIAKTQEKTGLSEGIVSGTSSLFSCAAPAFLPSAAVFTLSAFFAKVSSASIFLSFFLNNFIMSPYAINLLQM
jgi:acyl-CoA carboxylase subunit beta